MNGIMEFVLYGCKKFFCNYILLIVINSRCIKISNFLIESAFTGADFANFFKQLLEIISTKKRTIFQSIIIQCKTFNNIATQSLSGPLTKLCSTSGIDSISHRNNGIKIIMIYFSSHLSVPFQLNSSEFPNS